MTEEPYRWLEAITNRREYIEDQLSPGLPVVVLSADPGILLVTIKTSTAKLFEIYDHLALGCVGHPADIEKVRQTAIDAAHLEGFQRSPNDVTARRLVSYNLRARAEECVRADFLCATIVSAASSPNSARPRPTTRSGPSTMTARSNAQAGAELSRGGLVSGPRLATKEWNAIDPKPELARGSLKDAALSALKILLWAKLKGTKDAAIEFSAVPNDIAGPQGEARQRRARVRALGSQAPRPADRLSRPPRGRIGPLKIISLFARLRSLRGYLLARIVRYHRHDVTQLFSSCSISRQDERLAREMTFVCPASLACPGSPASPASLA